VQNYFENFPTASKTLSLLRQGGSTVILGNLITLPVGGGLLYTEPVYVAASAIGSTGSTPELKEVFAFYNGRPVGFGATLTSALAQVFTGLPGSGPGSTGGGSGGQVSAAVAALLRQAEKDYTQAQAALRAGNFTAYGTDLAKLKRALDAAQRAARPGHGAAPAATPKPRTAAGH
jgi:uncharacterized membrane protein (UPF0182 family)